MRIDSFVRIRTPWILPACVLLLGVLAPAAPLSARAEADPVMQAMEDEVARSMESLHMEGMEKPYFLSYRIDDVSSATVSAAFGGLTASNQRKERKLVVEIRVGDPSMDNTNYVTFSAERSSMETVSLPLEDNYQEIRRKIWLATDRAYKEALEDLSHKKAALQNKTRTEDLPDFSAAEPAKVFDTPADAEIDITRMNDLARDLSGLFRKMPQVSTSAVRLTCRSTWSRYANSEGTRFARALPESRFVATAEAYAPDGLPCSDFVAAFGRRLEDLPPREKLAGRIEEMGQRISSLAAGQTIDTYNGPVLFEAEAAAELWAQAFLPSVVAQRKPLTDNAQLEMFLQQSGSSLADKIGARVLPASMELVDDPTAAIAGTEPLLGGYSIDDDGVPAARTLLVEKGVLKSLLSGRNPARGAPKSTASRRGDDPSPSNVLVRSTDGLADKDLRKKLVGLIKERGLPYGVVVRRINNGILHPSDAGGMASIMGMMGGGGEQNKVEPIIAAFKVLPDGKEEPIRALEISGMSAGTFKDIAATSKTQAVVTLPFASPGLLSSIGRVAMMFGGPETSPPARITVATPALLFEDLTLKKISGDLPKPPIVGDPYFAR